MLTDSDTPPASQNRPEPVTRPPVMIDVGTQECPVSTSESLVLGAASVSKGPMLGLTAGVPCPLAMVPWLSLGAR